jgi:hypothetical protein
MQQHVEEQHFNKNPRRLLVGGMKAERVRLGSPLLKWYLDHGLEVSNVREVVEFSPRKCFRSFVKRVSEARNVQTYR